MRMFWIVLLLISSMLGAAANANAQKRVALVVGNSAYKSVGELPNPTNDASDIAGVLRKKGFSVFLALDLGKASFAAKLREFAQASVQFAHSVKPAPWCLLPLRSA